MPAGKNNDFIKFVQIIFPDADFPDEYDDMKNDEIDDENSYDSYSSEISPYEKLNSESSSSEPGKCRFCEFSSIISK